MRIFLFLLVLLSGCTRLVVVNLDKLQLFNESDWSSQLWYKGSVYETKSQELKNKIEAYISTHLDIAPSIKEALRSFTIVKGMNQEQVVLLLGLPKEKTSKKVLIGIWKTNQDEIWLYHPLALFYSLDQFGRFTFRDGILISIKTEHILYYGDL